MRIRISKMVSLEYQLNPKSAFLRRHDRCLEPPNDGCLAPTE